MTAIKDEVITRVKTMTDEEARALLQVIKNIQDTSADTVKESQQAYKNLQQYRNRIPADADYSKELAEFREKKYTT